MLKRILLLLVSGCGIVIAALLLSGSVTHCHHGPDCGDNCLANLYQIDSAKSVWALEHKRTGADTPSDSEIFGPGAYIADKPVCSRGGSYVLGRVDDLPRCTWPKHFLAHALVNVVDAHGQPLQGAHVEVASRRIRYFSTYTGTNGGASLSVRASVAAKDWWDGSIQVGVSKEGYRPESVAMPKGWPLRVILRKEKQ